jgi:hypothetical protein
MKVRKIAFGNSEEAFIEDRLEDHLNIIYSDDNNKGKTLVIQGLMYCLGNEPIFPVGFEYKKYYFYVRFAVGDNIFDVVRRNTTFVVKSDDMVQIYGSISDFKQFLNGTVFNLPVVAKDGRERLVDPALFYEIFFVGQDKRDTSNIFNKGFYKNSDFIEMLFSMGESTNNVISIDQVESINADIKTKRQRIAVLKKNSARIKIDPEIGAIALANSTVGSFEDRKIYISGIYDGLTELSKQRTRELNRVNKLEALVAELTSLNRSLEEGLVVCANCGSDRILYKARDVEFEVSNKAVKDSILGSIRSNIFMKNEVISDLTNQIEAKQALLTQEIKKSPPTFRDFVLFSEGLDDAKKYDEEITGLLAEIKSLEFELERGSTLSEEEKLRRRNVLLKIYEKMNAYYKMLDVNGRIEFGSLFTKKGETYSGSEEQEFFFCKALALRDFLGHNFPIVIDSFRDGEISTAKEQIMLSILSGIDNQVILSSTLKSEEYVRDKYKKSAKINPVDYSGHKDSAILDPKYVEEFNVMLSEFNIGIVLE